MKLIFLLHIFVTSKVFQNYNESPFG